ncbi:P-loop containing nucleoside triphosphate hydrolase protein [Biscogniauxia marginata]|nr:P-loop containing nucleoside triphosphate hydrolase protein [Biscogniauxia marginata]
MSDSSSTASFEDIGPSSNVFEFKLPEELNIEKLKALVDKSAPNGTAAQELPEDEVPDVCYVLQYRGLGGKLVDVRRSLEPIDIQLGELDGETASSAKKPVLEIVTVISDTLSKRHSGFYPHHQRLPPPPNPPQVVNGYNYGGCFGPAYVPGNEEAPAMKITQFEKTAMVINSPHLINALKAVVGYYPGTSFHGDSVKIMAPYQVLVHHREALEVHRDKQPEWHDEKYALTTAIHIDILLSFLDKTLGEQICQEEKRHRNSTPEATFDMLWLLLKPGEVIFAKYNHKWTPFVISRVYGGTVGKGDGIVPWSINCWNITFSRDFSSKRFYRTMHSFEVLPFSGEQAITSLPVIPANFFRGDKGDMLPCDVSGKEISLGKSVWNLSKGPSYMSYNGNLVQASPEYSFRYSNNASGYMSGRVIIDPEGYTEYSLDCPGNSHRGVYAPPAPPRQIVPHDQLPYYAPQCGCTTCAINSGNKRLSPFANFEGLDPACDDAPRNDLYYFVLTKVVGGFVLSERRWGHFNVEHLQEIKYDKEAFKYLVLDDEIKLTVKSLVGKFASAQGQVSPWPNDFVKNKGQGRIFLLHGSPGVGKTCTVECVAELTRRPLISLTSGDLSTNSLQVEKGLEYFLELGERFGALVLLDEADVYLESRRPQDVARNGLVSVFLRALEYYQGVLFLTTNRVRTFDAAFTSRIHVALHYGPLADADREKIWLGGFERLERDSGGRARARASARDYVRAGRDVRALRWNGREIRNALQTAVALAEAEAEALEGGDTVAVAVTDKHLRSVVKMSRGFKNLMRCRGPEGAGDDEDSPDDYGGGGNFVKKVVEEVGEEERTVPTGLTEWDM